MINIDKLLESKRVEVVFAEINVNGEYVKQFRKNHGLTQIALANIIGVTKKTVEKWEQGVNKVSGSSAVLLKLLNDNPDLLEQLYKVSVGVTGKRTTEEYNPIELKVINATTKPARTSVRRGIIAAIF